MMMKSTNDTLNILWGPAALKTHVGKPGARGTASTQRHAVGKRQKRMGPTWA